MDARAADLFELPPEEFTKARDALVKQLRKDGDAAAAGEMKALRRPTAAAWAVNQLARRGELDEVWRAGERVRDAQRGVVGGGDAKALQAAAAAYRRALAEAAARADADDATIAKVRETLEAALADDELRERVRTGTLEKEARHAGFGFAAEDAAAARVSPRVEERKQRKDEQERAEQLEREAQELEAEAARLASEADEAERHARRLRKCAEEAEAKARDARKRRRSPDQ